LGDDDVTLPQREGESTPITAPISEDNTSTQNNNQDEDVISCLSHHCHEQEESTCVICLEAFHVGEHVSWSHVSVKCSHVFHKDCILLWLVDRKNDDCPSCRSIIVKEILPSSSPSSGHDDDNDDQKDPIDDNDDAEEGSSMFVIMHGLVSRAARRASYSLIGQQTVTNEEEELCPDNVEEDPTTPAELPPMQLPLPPSPHWRVVLHGLSDYPTFTSSPIKKNPVQTLLRFV
jgi:hypothetical protein